MFDVSNVFFEMKYFHLFVNCENLGSSAVPMTNYWNDNKILGTVNCFLYNYN